MAGRRWTEEEIEKLDELRSLYTVASIAKMLDRTPDAVNLKLNSLGMVGFQASTDLLTRHQLCQMLGVEYRTVARWDGMGLRPRRKGRLLTYQQTKIIKFLKEHPEEWNAAKVTNDAMLAKYDWYKAKKKTDTARPYHWRADEEIRLKAMYRKGVSIKEIARRLDRSESSIKGKLFYMRQAGFKI